METKDKDEYILEVDNLMMHFNITTGFFKTTPLKAVDGVSFKIKKGETLGVVGESGCGKTTLGRTIMNLYKPSSGDILFDGHSISPYSDLKKIKVEKSFARKTLKFDLEKTIKTLKEKAKEDLEPFDKTNPSDLEKINQINEKLALDIQTLKEKCVQEIEASNIAYDEKYTTKKNEILSSLNSIKEDEITKISAIKVVELTEEEKQIVSNVKAKVALEKASCKAKVKELQDNQKAEEGRVEEARRVHMEQIKASTKAELIKNLKDNNPEKYANKDPKIKSIVYDFSDLLTYEDQKFEIVTRYRKEIDEIKAASESQIEAYLNESKYLVYKAQIKSIHNDAKKAIYNIKASSKNRMKDFRKKCTMVFQDPYSSLNPRMTVADIIGEPLDVNHLYSSKVERARMIRELMTKVGLSPEQGTRYAHEFSGGQRQRIGIARALAVNPKFIVCDEPVSALDVSIQAQVINTFEDLQKELGLTYLFIAHDLLVVRHISDRIAVMYLGRMVELATADELFDNPLHPYTEALLSAVPVPDPKESRANKRIVLEGDIPSPLNAPSGCPFRTRCPKACEKCAFEVPKLRELKPGHFVSCHFPREV